MHIDNSRYGFPIIISIRSRLSGSLTGIADLCEALAPVVFHSTTPEAAPDESATIDGVARLRGLAAGGALTLWNGGFAGAPTPVLTTAELDWERCWGRTNRWNTGLEQILETDAAAMFPNGLIPATAPPLAERARRPICGGYRPEEVGSVRDLFFYDADGWSRRSALVVDGENRPATATSFDLVHLIVDEGDHTALPEYLASLSTYRDPSDEDHRATPAKDDAPRCTRLINGIDRRGEIPLLLSSAVASRVRHETQGVTERTRAVLIGTAGLPGTTGSPDGSPVEVVRELQGMTSGLTEISEGSVHARFAAGRPAGLKIDGREVLLPVRSQGWARPIDERRPRTIWLEGDAAAWFTTFTTRGIQERSHISLDAGNSTLSVGIRSTVSEDLPALRVHVEVSFPATLPETPWSIEPIQLPIASVFDDTEIGVEMIGSPGAVTGCTYRTTELPLSFLGSALKIAVDGRSILVAIDGTAPPGLFSLSLGAPSESRGIRRATARTGERILWFNPTLSVHGVVPPELAGTRLGATYLITHGSHEPEVLRRLSEREELPLSWVMSPRF